MNTAIASLALFGASAFAGSYGYDATGVGSAIVVNKCNYPVKLCNVPSSGGGYSEEDKTLATGESWSQAWTELSNGNGWSIKLSKTDNLDSILQYEYTFHNDGIIWYDLSCVDGNPWDQDWEITANGTNCSPKQQAYRYATDDAYGMQSCSQDTAITVTLCTGLSADKDATVEASSSAPASSQTTAASPPSYGEPSSSSSTSKAAKITPTTLATSTSKAAKVTPTTLATSIVPTTVDSGVVTVTEVLTVYATAEVTSYANRFRRYDHGHGHQHQHQHQHHE